MASRNQFDAPVHRDHEYAESRVRRVTHTISRHVDKGLQCKGLYQLLKSDQNVPVDGGEA